MRLTVGVGLDGLLQRGGGRRRRRCGLWEGYAWEGPVGSVVRALGVEALLVDVGVGDVAVELLQQQLHHAHEDVVGHVRLGILAELDIDAIAALVVLVQLAGIEHTWLRWADVLGVKGEFEEGLGVELNEQGGPLEIEASGLLELVPPLLVEHHPVQTRRATLGLVKVVLEFVLDDRHGHLLLPLLSERQPPLEQKELPGGPGERPGVSEEAHTLLEVVEVAVGEGDEDVLPLGVLVGREDVLVLLVVPALALAGLPQELHELGLHPRVAAQLGAVLEKPEIRVAHDFQPSDVLLEDLLVGELCQQFLPRERVELLDEAEARLEPLQLVARQLRIAVGARSDEGRSRRRVLLVLVLALDALALLAARQCHPQSVDLSHCLLRQRRRAGGTWWFWCVLVGVGMYENGGGCGEKGREGKHSTAQQLLRPSSHELGLFCPEVSKGTKRER
mmetsp:Transcript_2663/g.6042  ORF Transcript_2663/g.6042 Transcript_2663/m.6042 type:complete len:447 (-) Transcript_2663:84-1424(-)